MKITKDPDSIVNFTVNWDPDECEEPEGPWLEDGDTIVGSTWIYPDALTKVTDGTTTTTATIVFSGGVEGDQYRVTNRITTAQGLVEDKSFTIVMEEH